MRRQNHSLYEFDHFEDPANHELPEFVIDE
jgi:hypothetical protein